MPPNLVVVRKSQQFSQFWPELASSVGAKLRFVEEATPAASMEEACAVIVAAGGVADRVVPSVERLARLAESPVCVVGANPDHRIACDLLQAGASDYFVLPTDLELLRSWAEGHVDLASCPVPTAAAPPSTPSGDFGSIVARSPSMRSALARVWRIAELNWRTVLITGETGTGKDLVARALHHAGNRATANFVAINCASIPASLVEAELFGYEQGAFTDARQARPGLFEQADGGTLFLDEIAELPLSVQSKLLRVLDNRRVRRLGGAGEAPVDVRIIAATHQDLEIAVAEGRFRKDLYYRLHVLPVHLPPLRERPEDVVALAEYFVRGFARQHCVERPELTDRVVEVLRHYTWPGNVRELRNWAERYLLLGADALHDLRRSRRFAYTAGDSEEPAPPFPATLESIARLAARHAVNRCGGNKSRAAEVLGISRKRLYSLLAGLAAGDTGQRSAPRDA